MGAPDRRTAGGPGAGVRRTGAAGAAGSRGQGVPRRRGRQLVTRTVVRAWDDNIFSESAAAAFWQTLSLPPLLLGLFGVLSYVGDLYGPDTVHAVQNQVVDLVGQVFSREAVQDIIAPTVQDILTTARARGRLDRVRDLAVVGVVGDVVVRRRDHPGARAVPAAQPGVAAVARGAAVRGGAGDGDRGAADRGDRPGASGPAAPRRRGSRRPGR